MASKTIATSARKPAPVPSVDAVRALRDRILDAGFRFTQEHTVELLGDDYKTRMSFHVFVDVIITRASDWLHMQESADGRWSCAVAGDDLVLATRFRNRIENDNKVRSGGRTEHDPDRLRALQAFRSQLFDFLEGRDDVKGLEMRAGGNGNCEVRLQLADHELGCDITLDIGADD